MEAETRTEMTQRHKRELKKYRSEIEAIMKKIPKADKAMRKQKRKEASDKEKEILDQHEKELLSAVPDPETGDSSLEASNGDPVEGATTNKGDEKSFYAQGGGKVSRKHKRQQARAQKEEAIREEARSTITGVSNKELEDAALVDKLAQLGLTVKKVPSDGHCMFRALADQLGPELDYSVKSLRRLAADYMLAHPADFSPFLGEGEDLDAYTRRLTDTAMWGGDLELNALSNALDTQICVYTTDPKPLVFGETHNGETPLRLTYHRHLFGLGEHYNSVKDLDLA